MPLTVADIDDFREFAIRQLNNGSVTSLSECVGSWEDEREYKQSIAGIRESLEDIAAGRTKPLDQAIEDIRQELGFSQKPAPS